MLLDIFIVIHRFCSSRPHQAKSPHFAEQSIFFPQQFNQKNLQLKTFLQLDELLHLKFLFTYSPNTKYSNNPHKILPTYYSNILHVIGLPQISSIHKPINCLGPSNKYYPLQPTYYPIWVFTKIFTIPLPQSGHKIMLSPQKIPSSFTLWAKPKKAQQYHLLILLLHGTLKPIAIRQYFTKSQNHFYKTQILIWHYFYKAQY